MRERKHIGKPQPWNEYFRPEIAEFCATKAIKFSDPALGILWAVAISDRSIHLGDVFERGLHFDFFQIYCCAPDDTLAVLQKMRQLHRSLSRAKRIVLCWDTSGLSLDAAAALAKGRMSGKEMGEAHEQVAKKQRIPTRRKRSE